MGPVKASGPAGNRIHISRKICASHFNVDCFYDTCHLPTTFQTLTRMWSTIFPLFFSPPTLSLFSSFLLKYSCGSQPSISAPTSQRRCQITRGGLDIEGRLVVMRWRKAQEKVTPETSSSHPHPPSFQSTTLGLPLSSLSLHFSEAVDILTFLRVTKISLNFSLTRLYRFFFSFINFFSFVLADYYLQPLAYVIHVLAHRTSTIPFRSLLSSCKSYVLPNHLLPPVQSILSFFFFLPNWALSKFNRWSTSIKINYLL